MKYKVVALLKHGCLLLDNGEKPQAKRSVNVLNETTLYFITLDNEVKRINRDVKDLGYKDVANNDYRIILDDVECRVDRETWNYIWDWVSWH